MYFFSFFFQRKFPGKWICQKGQMELETLALVSCTDLYTNVSLGLDTRHIFFTDSGSGAIGSSNHKARMLQRTYTRKNVNVLSPRCSRWTLEGGVRRRYKGHQTTGRGKKRRVQRCCHVVCWSVASLSRYDSDLWPYCAILNSHSYFVNATARF